MYVHGKQDELFWFCGKLTGVTRKERRRRENISWA